MIGEMKLWYETLMSSNNPNVEDVIATIINKLPRYLRNRFNWKAKIDPEYFFKVLDDIEAEDDDSNIKPARVDEKYAPDFAGEEPIKAVEWHQTVTQPVIQKFPQVQMQKAIQPQAPSMPPKPITQQKVVTAKPIPLRPAPKPPQTGTQPKKFPVNLISKEVGYEESVPQEEPTSPVIEEITEETSGNE